MFKKTVLMMALVMMASHAFATTEVRTEAKDAKRVEDEALRDGIKAARDAGIKDERLVRDIAILLDAKAKKNPALARQMAAEIKKNADVTFTSRGKSMKVSDIMSQLATEVNSGKADRQTAELMTIFVIEAAEKINNPGSFDAKVVNKEVLLAVKIASNAWAGTARQSHVDLIKRMLSKVQAKGESLEVASNEAFMDRFGKENAEKKKKDVEGCED